MQFTHAIEFYIVEPYLPDKVSEFAPDVHAVILLTTTTIIYNTYNIFDSNCYSCSYYYIDTVRVSNII